MKRLVLLVLSLLATGCAEPFTMFHTQTGEQIVLGRRSYSYEGCLATMQEEANRLGVTFRYVHVRGTTFGRSLLWPFEPGYACEAAIGPEGHPYGIYLNVPPRDPSGLIFAHCPLTTASKNCKILLVPAGMIDIATAKAVLLATKSLRLMKHLLVYSLIRRQPSNDA